MSFCVRDSEHARVVEKTSSVIFFLLQCYCTISAVELSEFGTAGIFKYIAAEMKISAPPLHPFFRHWPDDTMILDIFLHISKNSSNGPLPALPVQAWTTFIDFTLESIFHMYINLFIVICRSRRLHSLSSGGY